MATGSMSLDDLVALNDEMAALVRSGIPLELGLTSWGRDLSGPLRKTALSLGESIAEGRSLSDSLASDKLRFPPVYRAVVTAGIRSGRLPAALEAVAESAQSMRQLRGAIALSMIYPLLLVCVAYFLFLLMLFVVLPAMASVYEQHPPPALALAIRVSNAARTGIPLPGTSRVVPLVILPPLVLIGAAAAWWWKTRRAVVIDVASATRWLRWIPRAGRAVRDARTASLAGIFGLLIEHGVPLAEALRLATTSTGDRGLTQSGSELAAAVEAGQLPTSEALEAAGFPPILAMVVAGGGRQQAVVAMARQATALNRTRVDAHVQWLRDWLPMWMILFVGSVVGLVYCLTFFVPFSQFMQSLSEALNGSMKIGS